MMKCPYCDEEMEKGYIVSDAMTMAWRKEKHKSARVRGKEDGVQLSRQMFGASVLDNAYCCKNCKKIVLDYSEITVKQSF